MAHWLTRLPATAGVHSSAIQFTIGAYPVDRTTLVERFETGELCSVLSSKLMSKCPLSLYALETWELCSQSGRGDAGRLPYFGAISDSRTDVVSN